jgi:phosphatidylglycerophosphate synthase
MLSSGRKIPSYLDNPIDNILLDICDVFVPMCKKFRITPNAVTIFRMFVGIYAVYSFSYTNSRVSSIAGNILFYFLDCLDGHLARATNSVTRLGDYLDHSTDVMFSIGLVCTFLKKQYPYKPGIIAFLLGLVYLSIVHIGLQQNHYKKTYTETLDIFSKFHCLNNSNIKWTRYFGSGTLTSVVVSLIYFIQSHKMIETNLSLEEK